MKQSILLLWLLLSLAISGAGQQHSARDIEIPTLDVGTSKWPLKLTKQWFEDDTIYTLTFRDAEHSSEGKIYTKGFFIFELKALGDALKTALSIEYGYEVKFNEGTIGKTGSESNNSHILVRFATGAGSFETTEKRAKILIQAIEKESRIRKENSSGS